MYPILTVSEFCRRFHISRALYYKLKIAGKAPEELRVGNVVRITNDAVERWVRDNANAIPIN